MGSLVVKLDQRTKDKISGRNFYSDIDMLGLKSRRDNLLDVPIAYDVEAVKMSVRNILMWRVGESILRPDFGHNLMTSMYQQMTTFSQEEICEEIKRAIEDNETRVEVQQIAVKPVEEDEGNKLAVQVIYSVIGNKTDGANIVEEATISGK